MEPVRCFVAIELPEGLKRELIVLQDRLRSEAGPGVRWVDPRGVHLTLKFLGGVPAGQLDAIVSALEGVLWGLSPFRLALRGLGVFPTPRRVRVVWAGVVGDVETLQRLQQRVESALEPLGFPAEARAFTPHLTLARVRDQTLARDRESLGALIERSHFEAAQEIAVSQIHLVRSQLTRQGAIYSRLSSIRLGGSAEK